ncbi:MAG: APC family permease [Ignavibacteriales bacterium]
MSKVKNIFIGPPLKNEALKDEKLSILWGLPILASDAVSSVAYAAEEILLVLVPAIGVLSYSNLMKVSSAIVLLLVFLIISYTQTIASYPNGGGAYIVAKDNLGVVSGLTAGAALSVGYILTVAVSISSGTAAIVSAFPNLAGLRVTICIIFLLILLIGNLRGIRESAKIFSIPTYAFTFSIIIMIVWGFIKVYFMGYVPPQPQLPPVPQGIEPSILLLLIAFSSGCSALTGVEAVSNAVPNFKEPTIRNSQRTLVLLGLIVFICFSGISFLANIYHVAPDKTQTVTVLSMIASEIFGSGFMYYFLQAMTALILVLAANTAYSGFPLLISVMARDGYAPRQLTLRGDRLSYSNGIVLLTALSAILIVAFRGDTHKLIPLYAVGVFLSFTLSQSGMFVRWLKHKEEKNRSTKAFINGTGAFITAVAVLIIGWAKFSQGAWLVIIVIPVIIFISFRIKQHYTAVALQLKKTDEDLAEIDIDDDKYVNHVIVPIASINKASIRALRYAKTISNKVTAFHVSINEEDSDKIRKRWELLNTDIKLYIRYSPYRKIIEPLLELIESEEYEYKKGDMITVVLPKFSVSSLWHNLLHNHTRFFLENKLLKYKHIVVATMPLQLKYDEVAIDRYSNKEQFKKISCTETEASNANIEKL